MAVLINNGCPSGIKDNIAPIKAVRFFISKFTFNQYTNCRENRLYTISLKRRRMSATKRKNYESPKSTAMT